MPQASGAKHAGLYLLFTVLPVAVVVTALRLGRDLRPHVSIAGHWRADTETSLVAARACRTGWSRDRTVLEITQDGPAIELDFTAARLRLVGVFVGGSLEARAVDGPVPVAITGRIDGTERARALVATLWFACPYPLAVRMRAAKEP